MLYFWSIEYQADFTTLYDDTIDNRKEKYKRVELAGLLNPLKVVAETIEQAIGYSRKKDFECRYGVCIHSVIREPGIITTDVKKGVQ